MITTAIPEPISPSSPPPQRPAESAPSAMVSEGPVFARLVMVAGLALFLLGVVVVIATKAVGTPRMIPEGAAYLIASAGLVLLLFHAAVERDVEFRRIYGGVAVFALAVAVVISLVPGPFSGSGTSKVGYYLLPWGVVAGFIGLLFLMASSRHETEELYVRTSAWILLVFGACLVVGSVAAGVFVPEFMAGPGILLALLGVGFICGYFSRVDPADSIGHTVAFTLGVVGALTLVYAVARAVVPTVLYEGSSVLRRPDQAFDRWRVFGRGLVIFLFAALVALGLLARSLPGWLRVAFAMLGIAGAAIFVAGSTGSYISIQPKPFLVPGGVSLMAAGLVYLIISLGVCSDSQFVTLSRRELSAYFFSPIGILVLFGMSLAQGVTFLIFVGRLLDGRPHEEPIVEQYGASILNVFVFVLQIPLITMRLLADERRTGSLEVLLTAPVNEALVVGSKFLGALIFYLICWLPMGLYLIALTAEGTSPFDYRPMLGFYLCLAAQGAMFIAMGLFFSSLSKDQIVAAMFTVVVLILSLGFAIVRFNPSLLPIPDVVLNVLGRLSFYHMWLDALAGQLPMRDVLLELSLAVFGLFITTKVLEIRKWA